MSEFPAHWEFKTIGDFASRVRAKNTGGECQDPMTISAIDGLVSQRNYFNKIVASNNTEGYTLLHKNDFAYNKSYSDGYPVGAVRRLKTKDRGIVSPLYICFELDREQIDLHFADYLFDSDWFVQAIYGIAKEGARSHGLLNIGIEEFFSASLPIPPLPEQKKIAEILSGIDKSIQAKELSIQKIDSILRARKDDLMAGVEEWQEFELGELLTFRNGLNTEKENFGQGVPFVSYKNVYSGGIVTTKSLSQSVSLSAVEVERFSLRSGDILFTRTSETPDEIGFSCVFDDKHGSAVFNGFCIRGRPHEGRNLTPDFASFYLRSESVLAQMRFLCKYTTRAGISAESLSKVKVRIPDQRTQQQLANSLIAVNEFRTTQGKSVRNLKNVKKAVSTDLLSGRKRVSV